MLNIIFCKNRAKNKTRAIESYFDVLGEEDWLKYEFVKKVIREIDGADVVEDKHICSPFKGQFPPSLLSASAKALILMYCEPDFTFNLSCCGNDCAELILEAADLREAENMDITIKLDHVIGFKQPFEICIQNTGQIVNTPEEMDDFFHEKWFPMEKN